MFLKITAKGIYGEGEGVEVDVGRFLLENPSKIRC